MNEDTSDITLPETDGYYWAHFFFQDVDEWRPVEILNREVWIIGSEWGDKAAYWGIDEFGEKLVKQP